MINSPSYKEIQGGTTYDFALSQEQIQLQESSIRLICKTGAGAITINLPPISSLGNGLDYTILIDDADDMAGTNNITINVDPLNTIENGASYVINTNGAKTQILISSFTEFTVIEGGKGKQVGEGTVLLDAVGVALVPNLNVSATTKVLLTIQDGGAVPTALVYVSGRVAGASFTITSLGGVADAGVQVYYQLFEA